MFEGVVAGILNRFLGKYIQDLDTENLNVGIFSGSVNLTDLKLKPEALYELDLPIDVKVGTIGKISFQIPWSGLYTQPVIISIADVLILVGPAISNDFFDPEREKMLIRAAKRKILQDLESESEVLSGPQNFFENLLTAIVNNVQIFVRNVHVRYEDSISSKDCPFACGLCLQSLSIETTNSKWKPSVTPQGSTTVYQMMKLESLSLYWNPAATVLDDDETRHITPMQFYNWKHYMLTGLDKFSMHGEDFEFLLKPVTCKVKVIINRSGEARVPRLLVDAVLQDSAMQISRRQYLSINNIVESFQRMSISRKYRYLHPKVGIHRNSKKWWKYAYEAVLEQRVKPYTWQAIKTHRNNYHQYKNAYKSILRSPNDTELKLDLQISEDKLPIISIVIAREQAKIEVIKEDPNKIEVRESEIDWWKPASSDIEEDEQNDIRITTEYLEAGRSTVELAVKTERSKGLWMNLSSPEKQKVCELIGFLEGGPHSDKPKQYIEHKLNLTLANWSLTMMNRGKEILAINLTQFLASLETRPTARAYKLSARTESIVVEGANMEGDLVPMLTADNIYTGDTNTNFLAVDFEKNPLNTEADYGISCSLEPVEIVYHEHAFTEIVNFFQTHSMTMEDILHTLSSKLEDVAAMSKSVLTYAIERRKVFNIHMDLKGPYFVIPECGSVQKGGNILVVDMGRITVKSDLQPSNNPLEDATCMELEEKLYDRFHADCSSLQVLFCDSAESWRDLRKQPDSDIHLLPKIRVQVVFSNSIKKEYKLLPRYKLNIAISSLKVNLSDRIIGLLLDFMDNIPLPVPNTVPVSVLDCWSPGLQDILEPEISVFLEADLVAPDPSYKQLIHIRRKLVLAYLGRNKAQISQLAKTGARLGFQEGDKVFVSSEHSDEDMELWARSVDLPGFEDNVSPNNCITMLLRFVIGEVIINLSRSSNLSERPYVMVQLGALCLDTALLEFGPALQLSLRSLMLIDKQQSSASGEYLEMITTDGEEEFLNVLYRKVRANCPDFKSHFHSVEQSLVVDVGNVAFTVHAEAVRTMIKYLQYIQQKIESRHSLHLDLVSPKTKSFVEYMTSPGLDPPIPPGATKFSYSFRLMQMKMKLCHLDCDLLEARVYGLESDCAFKANDRMIWKMFLNNLAVDDLSDMTLYPKLLWLDEDKVFEMKYVRHSPRMYNKHSNTEALSQGDEVKSDGTFKMSLGRFHIVVLYKIIVDLQQFIEPLIPSSVTSEMMQQADKAVESHAGNLKLWQTRLHLCIDIHAPIVLLPQKTASPNLIVFNMGDLQVENFFKELNFLKNVKLEHTGELMPTPVLDNILLKLVNVSLSRAVMTLAGTLEVQEPILEPISIKFDIKRAVAYHQLLSLHLNSTGTFHRDVLLYDVDGVIDNVVVNLGQRDLSTMLAVWSDNIMEGQYMGSVNVIGYSGSPVEGLVQADGGVKKLQAFFAQGEPVKKEAALRLTLDGVELKLFLDMDEILSSPVRDLSHGLAKLTAGETSLQANYFSDKSLEVKASLKSLLLEDIRVDTSIVIRKMFQSHGGHVRVERSISVSTPPIVDAAFRQNQAGDRNLDVHIDNTRLNFSVPFFISLGRFILEALPGDKGIEGGVINHGYIGDVHPGKREREHGINNNVRTRPPSSADSTSGYYSTGTSLYEEAAGLSVSVQFRKPELMLFTELCRSETHALLVRTELMLEYSHHSNRQNFIVSLSGLQVMSKLQSKLENKPPCMVLQPCDVEFARTFKNTEEGIKVTVSVSPIDIRLAASTVHTVTDIIDDIMTELTVTTEEKEQFNFATYIPKIEKTEPEDIWSTKKLLPYWSLHPDHHKLYTPPKYPMLKPSETFTMVLPNVRVLFEMDHKQRIPVLMLKSVVEVSVHDWSKQMHGKSEINIQASCYNEKLDTWEPLIEPVVHEGNVHRPWEMLIKVFQAKSYSMSYKLEKASPTCEVESDKTKASDSAPTHKRRLLDYETSADEAETDNEMTFIKNPNLSDSKLGLPEAADSYLFSTFNEDESDSENDSAVMDKLSTAIGHLFTDDSSAGESSDGDDSSGAEQSQGESEENPQKEPNTKSKLLETSSVENVEQKTVTLQDAVKCSSVDSGLEQESFAEKMSTYMIVDARDVLNVTITPQSAQVLHNLMTSFTNKEHNSTPFVANGFENVINLVNDIGPGSTVHLVTRAETNLAGKDRVLSVADFEQDHSRPSTPGEESQDGNLEDHEQDQDQAADVQNYWECFEGGFATDVDTPTVSPLLSPSCPPSDPVSRLYRKVTDERLVIKLEQFADLTVVCPQRQTNKIHVLQPSRNGTRYYVVVQTDAKYKNRRIVVRSPLQIRNETSYAMGLYYKKSDLESIGVDLMGELMNPFDDKMRICIIEPDETYNVPIYVAYHCKLFLHPAYLDKYQVTSQGLWWQELLTDLETPRNFFCAPKDDADSTVFSMRVLTNDGCTANKVIRAIPNYLIRILPPVTIHNRLPYAAQVSIPSLNYDIRIEAGERTHTYLVNLSKCHKVTVDILYFGLPWTGTFNLANDLYEKTISMVTDCETDGGNKQLGLSIKIDRNESWDVYLHAPYWIINKTGLPLQLKPSRSDTIYDVTEEPLLYAPARRSSRAQKVRLRAHHSAWSKAFVAGAVGVAGLVVCVHQERKRKYRMLLNVSLSELCPQLTRIVSVLPYFLVYNESKRHLRFMEENEAADLWMDLVPGQALPFWPHTDSMMLHCKYRESSLVSQHFPITVNHFTVLRMDKGSALSVEVTGGVDKPFTITFKCYKLGDAPVRVDNLCDDLFLKLNQKELSQAALLSPYQSTLFTWDDPSKDRILFWNVYNNKGKGYMVDFSKDGYGEDKVSFHTVKQSPVTSGNSVTSKLSSTFKRLTPRSPEAPSSSSDDSDCSHSPKPNTKKKMRKDKVTVHWVSYMENSQRVYILTQDERIAYQYRLKIDSERSNYELYMSLSNIGLSICMQTQHGIKELSYISVTDSLPRWEVNVSHKWKLLSPDLSTWMEEKYKSDHKKSQLKEYLHVDFERMEMTKPFFAELRRTYNAGIWMQIRKSDTHTYAHLKVQHLQVDNQLNECIFPSVLYPASLPSNISKQSPPRPCLEMIVYKQYMSTTNQDVYKYTKVLLQEFCVNLDRGFVNYVFDIMNNWKIQEKPAVRLRADLALIHMPLSNLATKLQSNATRTAIFEYLHLSPVKLTLSLSSRGYNGENSSSPTRTKFGNKKENRPKLFNSDLLEFLFNSWGSSLCDMKDVKIKMGYLELRNVSMSSSYLLDEAWRHYWVQLVQQFYVLVLGLDILANPYSRLTDFTRGFGELFYEPYLISCGGEGSETAYRLGAGVASLLGHTVAATRATSVFSDQLAQQHALYFDEDYKKKRRYGFCLQPSSDVPETLMLMNNSFALGVALGLSGLIAKPTFDDEFISANSIYREASLLSRQFARGAESTGGACRGESTLRAALERAGSRLVARRRLPRHCRIYEGLNPYSYHEALGLRLLNSLGRGHYADTDTYLAHAALAMNSKLAVLLTNRRIFLVRGGSSSSTWSVEWVVNLDDLIGVPTIIDNKLILSIKQDVLVNYFSTDEMVIESEPSVLAWIEAKIESALIINMEDKHCPALV